jgi:hypothetical protein
MMDLEEKDNRNNMEILSNTIAKAAEATQIADGTLAQMACQREQLLRIDDDLYTINQTLAQCEKRIKGLNTNMFTALFHNSKSPPPKEVDTRYKAPVATTTPNGARSSVTSEPALVLPPHVHDPSTCSADKALTQFLETQKTKLEFAKGEKVMFHYCNTRQMLVLDQFNKCILLTNQRLLRIADGNIVNTVFLPDVVTVTHRPAKPLQYDVLVFKFVSGFEDLVEIWNVDVALFFKTMIDTTVRDLSARRSVRTDADLESRAKRLGMSDLEVKFERDKAMEDEQLDILGRLVDGLHERATVMGKALEGDGKIIAHLDGRVDATDDRLKKNQRGLDKLLGQPSTPSVKK